MGNVSELLQDSLQWNSVKWVLTRYGQKSRGTAKPAVYRFTQLITPPDCQADPKLVVKGGLIGTW